MLMNGKNAVRRTPMIRAHLIGMLVLLVTCTFLVAQDDEKVASAPKKGDFIPAPFQCFNINGPAKGRPHCLICKFALTPSVLVFAKEPAEDKDAVFTELLEKLEKLAVELEVRSLSVGVVILSPDARDSTNNASEEKAEEIIKEAVNREKLVERLTKRADKFKHVTLAIFPPEGPKKYNLNPKADMTVLFYERLKITEAYTYAPGALESKHVDMMIDRVREVLPIRKKVVE
jgi:hypothetical protein